MAYPPKALLKHLKIPDICYDMFAFTNKPLYSSKTLKRSVCFVFVVFVLLDVKLNLEYY